MPIQFDPMILQEDSNVPKYKLISRIIMENIRTGSLKPGDQLPPEPDLIEMFGVSRITVRAAVSDLVKKEIVSRKQGLGTFIRESQQSIRITELDEFTKSCELAGYSSRSEVISLGMRTVPEDVYEFLRVRNTDSVLTLLRLRYVNDQPCMLEYTYFSPKYMTVQVYKEDLPSSLYELFHNRFHIDTIEGRRYCEATFPNKDEQKYLKLNDETPVVRLLDLQFDSNGMPLFCSRVTYDSSVFQWGFIFSTKLS